MYHLDVTEHTLVACVLRHRVRLESVIHFVVSWRRRRDRSRHLRHFGRTRFNNRRPDNCNRSSDRRRRRRWQHGNSRCVIMMMVRHLWASHLFFRLVGDKGKHPRINRDYILRAKISFGSEVSTVHSYQPLVRCRYFVLLDIPD